jgi:capsular polysaccharide biosynthesis protein
MAKQELVSKGYLVVAPEQMKISEQIQLFENATDVVGFHGGSLANFIWCKAGTKVFEIQNHPYRTRDFESLANKLGLDYTVLNSEINVEQFARWISQID